MILEKMHASVRAASPKGEGADLRKNACLGTHGIAPHHFLYQPPVPSLLTAICHPQNHHPQKATALSASTMSAHRHARPCTVRSTVVTVVFAVATLLNSSIQHFHTVPLP